MPTDPMESSLSASRSSIKRGVVLLVANQLRQLVKPWSRPPQPPMSEPQLSGKTLKAKLGQSRPDGAGLPAELLAEGAKVPFALLVEGKEAGVVLG